MPNATLGHLEDESRRSGHDVDVEISQEELDKIYLQGPALRCTTIVTIIGGPGMNGVMVLPSYNHLRHGGKLLENISVVKPAGLPQELQLGSTLEIHGIVSDQ